ncbi:MAG: hypothetical protein OHK0012_08730 [Synechococcales cyanobacterium]
MIPVPAMTTLPPADQPIRPVDQGRAAYQAGSQAFQDWVTSNLGGLSLQEWQTLVLNIVGWPRPLTEQQRQVLNNCQSCRDIHKSILFLFFSIADIQNGQQFANIFSSGTEPEDFYLTQDDISAATLAAIRMTKDSEIISSLYEFLFVTDPTNISIAIELLSRSINQNDEMSSLFYAQAIFEAIEKGRKAHPESVKSLIEKLYRLQYFESFFVISEVYAKLLGKSKETSIYGILSTIADYFMSDLKATYDSLWDPEDFIDNDSSRSFVIQTESHLPAALGMKKLADKFSENCQFHLVIPYLSTAAIFYGIGGHFNAMKTVVSAIYQYWLEHREEIEQNPEGFKRSCHNLLFYYCYIVNYTTDDLYFLRPFQQELAKLYSAQFHQEWTPPGFQNQIPDHLNRPIRVGYLSHTFYRHSVSFLSVETLGFHDSTQVQSFFYYFDTKSVDDVTQKLQQNAYLFRDLSRIKFQDIVDIIRQDQIDVLIYLDVLTSTVGVNFTALRLAPIQITWLGGDSPGNPEIDYFLVDPYLLPEQAESVYSEKLIRIPSFVALRRFEITPMDPVQFRQGLNIPLDAVIYVTAAIGYKRNTEWIDRQLDIIAQVPNSYLVIKGISDLAYMTQEFQNAANRKQVGDRIRFLAFASSQEIHRGQLAAMDIMLDTFPYTGATHTAEALWQGVLVLTCYGQHYFSRMSSTMLQNIGEMEACIASSAEEYVAKGVRLGQDAELRQRLRQRLWDTRHSSILWDPYRQCRTMEAVYRQLVLGTWQEFSVVEPEMLPAESQNSAEQWHQAGLTDFRLGQQTHEVRVRHNHWERARECWRMGLERDPNHLPCLINRALILWYLGYPQASWQECETLIQELLSSDPDLSLWHAPTDLSAHVIWVPSYNTRAQSRRTQYLHLLVRWFSDHFSIVTNSAAQMRWKQAFDLIPDDEDARLVVAMNLLKDRQASGLFLLEKITHHPRAQLAMTLVTSSRPRARSTVTRPTELAIPYAGFQLYIEPRLDSIGTVALLARGDWFEGELTFCRRYLQPGMGVIDVGANVGVYTFVAAAAVGNTGRVYAVEPTPSCVRCLEQTVRDNGLESCVRIIAAAAGDEQRQVALRSSGSSVLNSVSQDLRRVNPELKGSPFLLKMITDDVAVPQITLDQLWEEEQRPSIHLLKIDTEGAEYKVLLGATELVAACQPVIILEVVNEGDLEVPEQCAQWLVEHGYTLYFYVPGLEDFRPAHPDNIRYKVRWGNENSVFNLIALPSSFDSEAFPQEFYQLS